jgi:uncharacterized membrane protein
MSNLVAIVYPEVQTAIQVRDKLLDMQRQKLITLEDAAVVEKRPDGKIKMHQVKSPVGSGAAWGAVWGGLIGMLFFVPFLGMAAGAAAGAAGGAMTDLGVDKSFMKELGTKLQPGGAALFLLIVQSTPDKVIPEVAQYGGEIVKTSLSNDAEEQLKEAVKAAQASQASASR